MARILVLYYSTYGHTERMAQAAAEGIRAAGHEAVVKRVPELMPKEVAEKAGAKLDQAADIATVAELPDYDGFVFGTPTRFGNMAAQMRNFFDQTGGLWAQGKLIGKPAGVFTSTATQHGGQESTILTTHVTLLHHGMIIVGMPYSVAEQMDMTEIVGGSPYGASTLAAGDGSRQPSDKELKMVAAHAARVAEVAAKLKA